MKTTLHTITRRLLLLALLPAAALPIGAYDFYANGLYLNETNNSYGGYFHSVVTYGPVKYHGNKTIPRGVWAPNDTWRLVDSVGDDAFRDCDKLTGVTFDEYIKKIGNNAFKNCIKLTTVDLPSISLGTGAFEGCICLENINFTGALSSIGDRAFKDCGIQKINLPASILSIGDQAFCNCPELRIIEIKIGESTISIGEKAFMGCNNLDTIKILGSTPPIVEDISAFDDDQYNNTVVLVSQKAIIKYYINDIWARFDNIQALDYDTEQDGLCFKKTSESTVSVVKITESANVNGIVSIPATIVYDGKPMSVASIGKNVFRSCNEITQVNCPATIKEIGEGAFRDCSNLIKVYIPDSVTHIGKCAFANCVKLTNSGGKGVVEVGDSAFAGCSQLQYPALANNIRRIGNNAYENCNLYDFRFNGILEIGDNAFKGSSINNLYFPSSLQNIGDGAYSYCNSLKEVVIEQRLSPIEFGERVFAGCGNLKTIVSHSIIPPQVIGTNIFEPSQNQQIRIFVPHSSVNSYRASEVWSCFSNYSAISIDFCVNSINYAFNGSGTVKVTYPDAYAGAHYYDSVDIPSTITFMDNTYIVNSIGDNAFNGSLVREVTIPNSVKVIGANAFCYSSLHTFNCNDSLESIGNYAFVQSGINSIYIPKTVKKIGSLAFNVCEYLSSIIVDDENPFYDSRQNCNAIIRKSDNTLLMGCKSSFIPESVTAIADSAFYGSPGPYTLEIPASVTNIGLLAFTASGVTQVTIPGTMKTVPQYSFAGANLKKVIMLDGIQKIDQMAFSINESLEEIVIPNTVDTIKLGAFSHCFALEELTIPNSVKVIEPMAFIWCKSLKELHLGSGLETIGDWAFNCETPFNHAIENIYCTATTPPIMLCDDCFESSYSTSTLYVPESSIDKYKTAYGWKKFFQILPIDESGINGVPVDPAVEVKRQRYNLMGQPVGDDYHGIVIENGKKILVE